MKFMEYLQSIGFGTVLTLIGAALAAILPGLGSAKALRGVGVAATGVITEDPEKYGKLLILQALPGTQGIYGLLCFFITLQRSGIMGGDLDVALTTGFLFLVASLPIAIVGYHSALHQGKVCEAAVALVAKRPEEQAKGVILAVMVETYAILALLATILAAWNIQ